MVENVNFSRISDSSLSEGIVHQTKKPETEQFLFDDWSTKAADAIGIAFNDMDGFLADFKNSRYEK